MKRMQYGLTVGSFRSVGLHLIQEIAGINNSARADIVDLLSFVKEGSTAR